MRTVPRLFGNRNPPGAAENSRQSRELRPDESVADSRSKGGMPVQPAHSRGMRISGNPSGTLATRQTSGLRCAASSRESVSPAPRVC